MRTKLHDSFIALTLLALSVIYSQFSIAEAQGTAFSYQGRLNNNGAPASGSYDLRFKLFIDPYGNTQAGSAFTTNAVPVTNGLFTTTVDFGPNFFNGTSYWLEVDVRTNGAGGYSNLSPLQAITPAPYAIYSETASNVNGTVPATQIGGTILNTSLPGSPNFSGTVTAAALAGNGANVTGVNAAALNGLNAASFWQLGGNAVSTGQFLGSTNNQPVEIQVNGLRAQRLEFGGASSYAATFGLTNQNGAPNVIDGAPVNFVAAGVVGAVIGGGGATNYGGPGMTNSIGAFSDFSVIGGGTGNMVQSNAYVSTIAGGQQNVIQDGANNSTIAGGQNNMIQTNSSDATIGGGYVNVIQTNNGYDTIAGGYNGAIQSNAGGATIGGGQGNAIWSYAYNSTVAGGQHNLIMTNSTDSAVGGGDGNWIEANSSDATIGGGYANDLQASATIAGGEVNTIQVGSYGSAIGGGQQNVIQGSTYATIAGGYNNTIMTNSSAAAITGGNGNIASGQGATVAGGANNTAGGQYSFAAGENAQALKNNTLVWSDGSSTTTSATNNSVTMRAVNGYRFFTGTSGSVVFTNGNAGGADQSVIWTPGSGSWSFTSDRTVKDRFENVDVGGILDKVSQLPITEWSYQGYGQRHIGAMAQDFHALFPLNDNDKVLNDADLHGVELAAIKGLNQKLNQKDAEIQTLETQLDELQTAVKQLAAQAQGVRQDSGSQLPAGGRTVFGHR